jgi:hypothetical protein
MDANTFVKKLLEIVPTYQTLKALELPDDFILKIIDTYHIKPKEKTSKYYEDDILELINSYDVSKIEIGMITFLNEIIENEELYIIGKADADYLVINKLTNEIEIHDEVDPEYIKLYCAKDSSSFLNTLIISCAFFNECAINKNLWKDKIKTYAKILECADKAGGEKYLDFFLILFDYSD